MPGSSDIKVSAGQCRVNLPCQRLVGSNTVSCVLVPTSGVLNEHILKMWIGRSCTPQIPSSREADKADGSRSQKQQEFVRVTWSKHETCAEGLLDHAITHSVLRK